MRDQSWKWRPVAASDGRRIVEALGGSWRGAAGMCRCPAHDDRNPSLSVGFRNGRVLLHCFAGCEFQAVVAALRRRGLWT